MSEAMAAVEKAVRFGIKINKNEEDSIKRVTYLYDAVGMIPAVMDAFIVMLTTVKESCYIIKNTIILKAS